MGKIRRLRLGKRKNQQIHGGYVSTYLQPYGKKIKRKVNRKTRKIKEISNGSEYKKLWGPLELS